MSANLKENSDEVMEEQGTKPDMRHETRAHGTSPAIIKLVLGVNRVLNPAKERKMTDGLRKETEVDFA